MLCRYSEFHAFALPIMVLSALVPYAFYVLFKTRAAVFYQI